MRNTTIYSEEINNNHDLRYTLIIRKNKNNCICNKCNWNRTNFILAFIFLPILIFFLGYVFKIIIYWACNNNLIISTNSTNYQLILCNNSYTDIHYNIFSDIYIFLCHVIIGLCLFGLYHFFSILRLLIELFCFRNLTPKVYFNDDGTIHT